MPPIMLLSCESISKSYGVKPLFSDLSIGLAEGDRVGLIGPNGSGKSTLLKILAGIEDSDDGTRSLRRHVRLSYVPQESTFPPDLTVEEVLAQTLREEGLDPHEESGRISRVLSLGEFPDSDQLVRTLSGGWKKRLAIARSLLMEPDVLMMDEPTNHLDVEGILWLERLLKSETRAYLVISHDRRFLESVAERMIELNRIYPQGVFEATGHYSDFLEAREANLAAQANEHATLANKVRREVEWLRRGPKARTTKAKARIDAAGALISDLADRDGRRELAPAGIDFTASGRKSKQLIVAQQLSKTLGSKPIVKDLELILGPGQRLGLLGPNGSGKSTLMKLLAGTMKPDAGTVTQADKLRIVTFEQHRESLNQQVSLRRSLAPAGGDSVIYQDRSIHLVSWAKRFLFRPEQLDLPVSRLSGGEQARLLIARLMLQPADVLMLDEPTNDLDIPTLDVLEENLLEFPGALILVTHDRWLLDRVSTMMLALDGTGNAEWFADFAQWEAAQERTDTSYSAQAPVRSGGNAGPRVKPAKSGLSYAEQKEWDKIEARIEKAEAAVAAAQRATEDSTVMSNAAELHTRYEALEAARTAVERLYTRWADLDAKRTPDRGQQGRPGLTGTPLASPSCAE